MRKLVREPPWTQEKISGAGKMRLRMVREGACGVEGSSYRVHMLPDNIVNVSSFSFFRHTGASKSFSQVLNKTVQRTLKLYSPTFQTLQTHWEDWFCGTEFQSVIPERLDRWNGLWLKVPDAILRQKLQFQSEHLLKTLNALLSEKIEGIHWVV